MDHRINHYAISHFLQPNPENQPEQSSNNISFLSSTQTEKQGFGSLDDTSVSQIPCPGLSPSPSPSQVMDPSRASFFLRFLSDASACLQRLSLYRKFEADHKLESSCSLGTIQIREMWPVPVESEPWIWTQHPIRIGSLSHELVSEIHRWDS
ncbi:15408_t:CDS:2 [Entrophospora sp. SA101]|nr:15408_t:CDS:2 [Entrophospora sp. SA101]